MQDHTSQTRRFGDEAAGFCATYISGERFLRLEGWGHWTVEIAEAFAWIAEDSVFKVATPLDFVLDARELKPQSPAGQSALRMLLKCLAPMELSSTTVLVTNALTRMQLSRLALESGLDAQLRFQEHQDGET